MTTDTQFSVREVPWMKIGRIEDQPKTAAEAAELGGLNFTVSLRDVGWIDYDDGAFKIPHRKAVIADDNGDFMGFASTSMYKSLQYSEAFNFMDTLGRPYVAAGALRGRRQGFMVVQPDIDMNVLGGEDPHALFAVLRTSHDSSRAVEVSVMPLRGRCMNQLTLKSFAVGVPHRWSIKHTTTMHAKLAEAQKSLKNIGIYAKRYEELAAKLANITVTESKARKLLEMVIPMPATGKTERTQTQHLDRLNIILNLWSTSPTVAYAGTGWGLVNAVSEYQDWYRAGGTAESRFIGALEGQSHKKLNKMAGLLLSNA